MKNATGSPVVWPATHLNSLLFTVASSPFGRELFSLEFGLRVLTSAVVASLIYLAFGAQPRLARRGRRTVCQSSCGAPQLPCAPLQRLARPLLRLRDARRPSRTRPLPPARRRLGPPPPRAGALFAGLYPRVVKREIQPFDATLRGDVSLALQGVIAGSPFILLFEMLNRHFGVSLAYMDFGKYSLGYWLFSIPAYLLIWDFWFYVLHLVLHWEPVYALSHRHHHAFRPPTAWSGIAVDFLETWLSGLLPLMLPLFLLPVHLPTAYVLNILLEGWATMLHSSCPWDGTWLTIGATDHNVHHEKGRLNQGNYSAIFTVWDRVFGTLLRDRPARELPYWIKEEREARRALVKGAGAGEAVVSAGAGEGAGAVAGAGAGESAGSGGKAAARRVASRGRGEPAPRPSRRPRASSRAARG